MKKLMAILISLTLLCGALPAWAEAAVKDETVYILASPDGAARRIIVSDWLSNPDAQAQLADESALNAIENVKGEQEFANGFWQADGQDIYYQGESDAPLPVELQIRYTLDGQAMDPAELAGKDGRLRIRFDYSVRAEANGAPFAAISGVMLDNDVFSNVKAVNAQIINDGDRCFVVGLALLGLQTGLDLDAEQIEFPEYVEIEADVQNFALPMSLTLASSEPFALMDSEKLEDTDDLKNAMQKLSDGMAQLLDGGAQLGDGLAVLGAGADEIASGVNALSDGLNTLTANNASLVEGSTQVFNSLLASANQQLSAAGVNAELTIEGYAETLSALIESMSEAGITQQARAQVEAAVRAQQDQVRAGVAQAVQAELEAQLKAAAQEQQLASEAMEGMLAQQIEEKMASEEIQTLIDQNTEAQLQVLIDQSMAGDDIHRQIAQNVEQYQSSRATLTALKEQLDSYAAFHAGLIAYTEGASAAAEGALQLKGGMPSLQDGIAQLQSGAQAMQDGLSSLNSEGIEKLDALVNEDLENLLERARGLIDAAKALQNYSGIAANTEGRLRFVWRTDA